VPAGGHQFGAYERHETDSVWKSSKASYRLYRCAGCGMGAFAKVMFGGSVGNYPGSFRRLIYFFPESGSRLPLPSAVPAGIQNEFREGESCLGHECLRAAAGMFRSVLDKTMRANGYKTSKEKQLYDQIEAAAADGVITESRKLRAHSEIRVLGNDVLHDDWQKIPREDVEASRHYCQRILEDLYDDRPSVLALIRKAGRTPDEDKNVPNQSIMALHRMAARLSPLAIREPVAGRHR
jgi:hypothetical protein